MRAATFALSFLVASCSAEPGLSAVAAEADAAAGFADAVSYADASAHPDAVTHPDAMEYPDAGALACDPPPPPIDRLRVVIYNDQGYKKVLDSTPIIEDREYCNAAGFGDRLRCPPRPDGAPDTEACNAIAVGYAEDTGRVGPTWTYNDQPCAPEQAEGRCVNHRDNQFLVFVYGSGRARGCSESGVCGEVDVP